MQIQINSPRSDSPQNFFLQHLSIRNEALQFCDSWISRNLEIESFRIQIHLSSPSLLDFLTPSIGHLLREFDLQSDKANSGKIYIWDRLSTGRDHPSIKFTKIKHSIRGEIPELCSEDYYVCFFPHFGMLVSYSVIDKEVNISLSNSRPIPAFEYACPLRVPFSWLLASENSVFLHGAAVYNDKGAWILIGRSGQGKSSLVSHLVKQGYGFISDDLILYNCATNRVTPFYKLSKLRDPDLHLLNGDIDLILQSKFDYEKTLFWLRTEILKTSLPVAGILVLTREVPINVHHARDSALGIIGSTTHSLFPLNEKMVFKGATEIVKNNSVKFLRQASSASETVMHFGK